MLRRMITPEQVPSFCQDFVQSLGPQTAVLLTGTLGAGKTFLVNELLKTLGGEEALSPTFSLINTYQSQQQYSIYHVDLYRMQDSEDLESSGLWDLFADKNSVIFIEWACKIKKEDLPLDWKILCIDIQKIPGQDFTREFRVT